MDNSEKTLDQLVALCKGRGFVYPGSEIYGGLANTWDYGPLGVELKENIKKAGQTGRSEDIKVTAKRGYTGGNGTALTSKTNRREEL